MNALEQASIYLEEFGTAKIPNSFRIVQQMGHHAQLAAEVWVEPEETDNILRCIPYGKSIILKDKKQYSKPLFCGILYKAHLKKEKGMYTAQLEAYSCSYAMDKQCKNNSYQKRGRTKCELAALLVSKYKGVCTWTGSEKKQAAGEFLMQYHETDWEFLKRIASKDNRIIFPEINVPRAEIYIGLPQERDMTELSAKEGYIRHGYADEAFGKIEYIIQERYEDIPIGSPVKFLEMELYVYKKETYLSHGLVYHDYTLRPATGCIENEIKNPHIVGAAISGKVVSSTADMTQLSLNTDIEGEQADAWHTRAVYYSGGKRGYSGCPEVGDIQYLYFPTMNESDRYIIGGAGADFGKLSGMIQQVVSEQEGKESEAHTPQKKSWGTQGAQNITLSDTGVYLSANGGKGRLNLTEKNITFRENKNICLKGGTIKLKGKNVYIDSKMYISIRTEPTAIAILSSEIQMKAVDVKIESPLNQKRELNLPPVEEILKSIEESKKSFLPVFASDGSAIQREGYGEIIESEELYLYFVDNYLGKEGKYENKTEQPPMTLYETWLSDIYGETTIQKISDYIFSIDGLQVTLDIIGFVLPQADLVNCIISLGRGKIGDAALSAIGALPLLGKVINRYVKWRKRNKVIKSLEYTFETVKEADTINDSVRMIEALDDAMNNAKNIGKEIKDTAKEADTIRDAAKTTDVFSNITKASEDAKKEILYVYEGQEVGSDLAVRIKVIDNEGKIVDTVIQGSKDLPKRTQEVMKGWSEKDWEVFHKLNDFERKIYLEAIDNEGEITESLKRAVLKNGGYLDGLEHRIKSPGSVFEKAYLRSDPTPVIEIRDIVRYTEIQEPEKLVQSVKGTLKNLEDEGYTILKVKNTWIDELDPYNGINVQLKAPNSQTFELQFHTPESFKLKNGLLHELYEQGRCERNVKRLKKIKQQMFELSNNLVKPIGIETIENIP